jgi:hypothetical protein
VRKLFGAAVLVIGLTLYCLMMMVVGATLVPDHVLVQLLFYASAGLAWIWPAAKLVRWSQRPPA